MDDDITELSRKLGEMLKRKAMKLVTAESCTGGGLAQVVTDIPGSSAWFDRGFITYSNQSKVEMLHVQDASLDNYGAVSQYVAIEMADGALNNSRADVAVSITGIAGPSGGLEGKVVGTVYIACKVTGKDVLFVKECFIGDRLAVRMQAIKGALMLCLKEIDR